jgi:hypothetical protein
MYGEYILRREDMSRPAPDDKGHKLFKTTIPLRKEFCETNTYTVCPKYVAFVAHLKKVIEGQEKLNFVP